MELSGVFYLSLALWPKVLLTIRDKQRAFSELNGLIAKQYEKWVEFRELVTLPLEYGLNNRQSFLIDCRAELQNYISSGSPSMRVSTAYFVEQSNELIEILRAGRRLPKPYSRGRKYDGSIYNLEHHWNAIAVEIPALAVVYRVLSHCAATEAAAERFFSSEAIIHSRIRNRMDPDLIKNIMYVRWNHELVKRCFLVIHQTEELEEVDWLHEADDE